MGQYWKCVNLDKKEFVHPHKLGAGLKLWEQVSNHPGTGTALVILCAAMRERRGGGDLTLNDEEDPGYREVAERTIGRWAGDRVALIGDYAEDSDLPPELNASEIYGQCVSRADGVGGYRDVTEDVVRVIEHELRLKNSREGWSEWSYREKEYEEKGQRKGYPGRPCRDLRDVLRALSSDPILADMFEDGARPEQVAGRVAELVTGEAGMAPKPKK